MYRRVGSASRELNKAAFIAGSEPGDALVNPVFILGLGQSIDIKHRLPLRLGSAV